MNNSQLKAVMKKKKMIFFLQDIMKIENTVRYALNPGMMSTVVLRDIATKPTLFNKIMIK